MPLRLRRPSPLTLLCAGLLVVYAVQMGRYLAASHGIYDPYGYLIGRDFANTWLGARMVADGQVLALYDREQYRLALDAAFGANFPDHFWLYPPHYIFLVLPFGLESYLGSYALWVALTFAVYAGAVVPGQPGRWPLLVVVLALAPSTFLSAFLGQNGLVSAALFVGGLRLLEARPVLAGVLFGLLTMKPQLGVLIPLALLAAGAWRTIAAAAVTAVLLVGASAVVFGTAPWLDFFGKTTALQAAHLTTAITGWHQLMVTPFVAMRHLGLSSTVGYAVNGVTALLAAAAVLWAWRQAVPAALRHAVLIVATFLAVPYALAYDLTVVSAAVVLLWLALPAEQRTLGFRVMAFLVWVLPFANQTANNAGLPIGALVLGGFLVLLLRMTARAAGQRVGGAVSE